MTSRRSASIAVAFFILALFYPQPCAAQVTINPGGTANITTATGSGVACRIGDEPRSCNLSRFSGTEVSPGTNTVHAVYDQQAPTIGEANYAAARLHADIELAGPPNSVVDVQIATTFDFDGAVSGAGAYKTTASASLHVTDITGSTALPVASHTLFQQERSGDQGPSPSIDVAGESQTLRNDASTFRVTLRRGRTYRLTFEAQVLGEALVVGAVSSEARATWIRSAVTVDEDEADLLSIHDTAIQTALAAHDDAVRTELAQHDADIKQELAEIRERLDDTNALLNEIKQLLLTPQGRREGFPIKVK
ncbi:MAG TPA: hypothetical protein VFO58_16805 [Vicinamibacterales bacterium]|nr:hypothetical protein [Vicinamibacterales bacterium]